MLRADAAGVVGIGRGIAREERAIEAVEVVHADAPLRVEIRREHGLPEHQFAAGDAVTGGGGGRYGAAHPRSGGRPEHSPAREDDCQFACFIAGSKRMRGSG